LVFGVKENPDGSIKKYKACLVVKGFYQKLDFDYNETSSPVVKLVTVRIVLTLSEEELGNSTRHPLLL